MSKQYLVTLTEGERAALRQVSAPWQLRCNAAGGTVDWRFTTDEARIKLKRLYSALQE